MPAHSNTNHARAAFVLLLLGALPCAVQAQLYTWRDAQGNVIIKNAPPPWYSESQRSRGARVQVLRSGKVVDDTAWPVERRQDGQNQYARDEAKRVAEAAAEVEKKQQENPSTSDATRRKLPPRAPDQPGKGPAAAR